MIRIQQCLDQQTATEVSATDVSCCMTVGYHLMTALRVNIQNLRGEKGGFKHDSSTRFLTSIESQELSLEAQIEAEV